MSKKNKNTPSKNTDSVNSYKINTGAVDRLVNADKKTYPKTKVDPGKKYRSQGLIDSIPAPIKAMFIKFWFNGAVYFFIIWTDLIGSLPFLEEMLVLAIVLGMVNDILVNNTFHFFSVTPGENDKWMMFPQRKFWTFFANIIYSAIVLVTILGLLGVINLVVPIHIQEPIMFGLSYLAVDMLYIGMKNLVIKIFHDAKEKADK